MASLCTKTRVAAALLLCAGTAFANNPLPGFAQKTVPVVFFLLDTSGSMNACDGGEILPARDLTPAPGGGYLFDPLAATNDDGACTGRTAAGPYQISRLEAMKLSLSRILDADGNGAIDTGDEELLRLEIGVANYPDFTDTQYAIGTGRTVGSAYADVWTTIRGYVGAGNTPTGPALAGARARYLQNCYDEDQSTSCALGQNLANGNDKGLGCRDYFVVLLTDGEPNTDVGGVGFDPLPVARALTEKQKVVDAEATPAVRVRTFAIGLGADVTGIGSNPRGYINCTSFWGSRNGSTFTDANKDGDGNANTMKENAGATPATVGDACNADEDMNATVKGLGHGYFATDARELSDAFKSIMNAIQAGTYSRSEPTTSATGTTTAGEYVYGSFFDITAGALDWRGHLRKYRFNGSLGRYVDCNSPTTTSNPVRPCWDAGGWYGGTNLSPYNYTGLYERDWKTRRIYVVNPANVSYDPDLLDESTTRPTTSAQPTILNVVSRLPQSFTGGALPNATDALYGIAALTQMADVDSTYALGAAVPAARLTDGLQTLAFTAGQPTSTFASGQKRCGSGDCDDSSPSPKLGDSFNSRPAIVGPPVAVTLAFDYNTEFRNRVLDTYTGDEAPTVGGTTADPCDGRRNANDECTVSLRRTAIYLAANDGMVHAFDEKTGEELWAFIPPGHMSRLGRAREGRTSYVDGLPTVRDVRFPCDRQSNGECSQTQTRAFADGKWHTVVIFNQGTGGNFLFALDITNPVKPVFLWEYRKPMKLGLTVARATIGEISKDLPTLASPGSAVFVPGGYFPSATEVGNDANDTTTHPHFFSLRVLDGQVLAERHIDPKGLGDDLTTPSGLVNAMTGSPTPVDGDFDGAVDRVYFGDREGRLWKAYGITAAGSFSVRLFFDPALYDVNNAGEVGQPFNTTNPGQNTDAPDARETLRGPIFFAPDVTRDIQGNLLVAFGSGNMLDPLSSPSGYKNFVWVVQDSPSSAASGGALVSRCGAGTDRTWTAGGKTFEKVLPMSDLLTGAPYIFKGYVFYPEFDPDSDDDGDVCEDDVLSRIVALNAFDCGTPGDGPFRNASNQPTNKLEYPGALVTGIQIDPRTGNLFTQTSTAGANPPTAQKIEGFAEEMRIIGFRQPH